MASKRVIWIVLGITLGLAVACADLNGEREIYPPTTRPTLLVLDQCPGNGEDSFFTGGVIRLLFNKPLDPTTLTQQALLLGHGRRLIRGAIELDGQTLTYIPREILVPDARYDFFISGSLRDTDGFALTDGYWSFTFTTGHPGAVSCRGYSR